jgi:hypothetical protein
MLHPLLIKISIPSLALIRPLKLPPLPSSCSLPIPQPPSTMADDLPPRLTNLSTDPDDYPILDNEEDAAINAEDVEEIILDDGGEGMDDEDDEMEGGPQIVMEEVEGAEGEGEDGEEEDGPVEDNSVSQASMYSVLTLLPLAMITQVSRGMLMNLDCCCRLFQLSTAKARPSSTSPSIPLILPPHSPSPEEKTTSLSSSTPTPERKSSSSPATPIPSLLSPSVRSSIPPLALDYWRDGRSCEDLEEERQGVMGQVGVLDEFGGTG